MERSVSEANGVKFRKTPESIIEGLYMQLSEIHRVLTTACIPYWLNGGCLLGQVRGGEIIPWDDDCDIGVSEEYQNEVFHLLSGIVGVTVWNSEHGLKVFQNVQPPRATTDVFFYQREVVHSDIHWVLSTPVSRKAWPNDWFLESEIVRRKIVKLGEIDVYVPDNPERYLKELYGKDCLTHACLGFDHLTNKKHERSGVEYPIESIVVE